MEQTLYESIGGAGAVEAAVDLFYERVWNDPDLVEYFDDVDPERLKSHQRAFISAALGGPAAYAGRPNGRGSSRPRHHRRRVRPSRRPSRRDAREARVPPDRIGQIAGALAPLRDDIVERPAASAA